MKQGEEQDVRLDAWRALLGALDGRFAPAKKGSAVGKTAKPSTATGQNGSDWSVVAVFRWEFA